MLSFLRLENFAIVDRLALELSGGFVAVTGETGAGKSLLVHALEFVLGGRPGAETIRHGSDRTAVEAGFDLDPDHDVWRMLRELGITGDPEELLVLKRLASREGKGRAWVNGAAVQVKDLRGIGESLVDIHGQHEHQSLLNPSVHLALLDGFSGCVEEASRVARLRSELDEIDARIVGLEAARDARSKRIEFLQYQISEIERAELSPGEERGLEEERSRLQHVETLADLVKGALCSLSDEEGERLGARDLLAQAVSALEEAVDLDGSLGPAREACARALVELEAALTELQGYAGILEADPTRLDVLESRLAHLSRLKKKHGGSVEEILARLESFRAESAGLSCSEEELPRLKTRRGELLVDCVRVSDLLSERRRQGASRLGAQVSEELGHLGMDKARFEVALTRTDCDEPVASGWEKVEFLFAANPGHPARPLRHVASGGELSRTMMALKTVLAGQDRISSLVFDEVDANVGGRLGETIGQKLRCLARGRQVLCITHLAQIAAMADQHFRVSKVVERGQTKVSLFELEGEGRVAELASMLAGPAASATTMAQARELLEAGRRAC